MSNNPLEIIKFLTDSNEESTITKINVSLNQEIKTGDVIFEYEMGKATDVFKSPKSGKIIKINFNEGDVIKPEDVIIELGDEIVLKNKSNEIVDLKKPSHSEELESTLSKFDRPLITPRARKLAYEKGISGELLKKITGSGPDGRILQNDILQFCETKICNQSNLSTKKMIEISENTLLKNNLPSSKTLNNEINVTELEGFGKVMKMPITKLRRAISDKMTTSAYTIPHVSLMIDVNAEKLITLRNTLKEEAIKEVNGNIKLTFLPFFIKAVTKTLMTEEFQLLNATFNLSENEIIIKKYYNIGIAVDTPEGLVVPVIKNAEQLSLFGLAKSMNELIAKSKSGKITANDMKGGTFTITNFGSAGLKFGTPIINYPEVAILGIGALEYRVILNENNKQETIPSFPLSLSFDHRLIDGAPAGYFLKQIKYLLENPTLILA
jgi:pyruvate dehydrogenase E2 component (dihydrolipoamide acetyltransferase)